MRFVPVALALAALSFSPPVLAEEEEPNDDEELWDPTWSKFSTEEYVATGVMLGAAAAGFIAIPQNTEGWKGPILFDEPLRRRATLDSLDARQGVQLAGDIAYFVLMGYPVLIDGLLIPLAVHRDTLASSQSVLMSLESLALTGMLSVYSQKLVGRERPFVQECAADPEYDPTCDDEINRNQSFMSGHTAMAFAGAALTCSHALNMNHYGSLVAGAFVCGTVTAGASFVGWSRVLSDRHYASDVLTGAAVGATTGVLLPYLLHYGEPARVDGTPELQAVTPMFLDDGGGVQLMFSAL